jgi:hypothetical protein
LTNVSLPKKAGWPLLVADAALAKKAVSSCLYMRITSTIEFRCARYASWPPTDDPSLESSGVKSSLSSLRSAGKPVSEYLIVPRRPEKNRFRSGAALPAAISVGLSSLAAG